ncbi:MAG: methylenetetrahydrofolate reductase [Actinomycetota bacterium]|nr:methylenetetrahydrofolate reductase [Actinomycetota bacterium]
MRKLQLPDTSRARSGLADLVSNMSYEVMPFKGTGDKVLEHVPTHIPITVTVTEAKGIKATLELSERLSRAGYSANPHLPARQIRDEAELADIVAQLQDAGIEKAFVIGGDATEPAGQFADALSLLHALDEMGRPLNDIGISGYPEGHGHIAQAVIDASLVEKAPYAARIVTQMCFDAQAIIDWAAGLAARELTVPVIVGVPGPVTRQKLVRISAGIGLGQSARFLQKQQGMVRRLVTPGGFAPNRLLRKLGNGVPRATTHIKGIRIFTFNEIARTEAWRRELAAALVIPPAGHAPPTDVR